MKEKWTKKTTMGNTLTSTWVVSFKERKVDQEAYLGEHLLLHGWLVSRKKKWTKKTTLANTLTSTWVVSLKERKVDQEDYLGEYNYFYMGR